MLLGFITAISLIKARCQVSPSGAAFRLGESCYQLLLFMFHREGQRPRGEASVQLAVRFHRGALRSLDEVLLSHSCFTEWGCAPFGEVLRYQLHDNSCYSCFTEMRPSVKSCY
jgi:hypothetical protein